MKNLTYSFRDVRYLPGASFVVWVLLSLIFDLSYGFEYASLNLFYIHLTVERGSVITVLYLFYISMLPVVKDIPIFSSRFSLFFLVVGVFEIYFKLIIDFMMIGSGHGNSAMAINSNPIFSLAVLAYVNLIIQFYNRGRREIFFLNSALIMCAALSANHVYVLWQQE